VIASRLNLQFSGLARLKDGLQLAGTMEASTRSIRELAKWTGNPLQPGKGLGPFSARAGLDLTPRTIKLSKAKISLDGMNAQGSLSVKLGGRRPAITASIGMDQINVNTYLAAPSNAPAASTPATSEWSNRPIDFSGLKAVDANLSIATSQIVYRDVKIGTTRLTATLMGGVLKAKLKEMAFYDGKANGVLVLNGARTRPVIQGALNATGLNGFRLLRDFAKFKRLEGTAQLRLSLAATGRSQRELVSTLAGKAAFRFTNGAIRGINIAAMIRNVQKSILGGWDKSGNRNTDFSVLSASFVFKDGIGRNDDLQMLGPLVRLTGKGEVDMLSRRINYRTEPKLVATLKGQGGKTELSGLAVPVIIKGPWAKPKIYPDIKGILSNPQAAYDKLRQLIGKGKGIDLKAQKKKLTGKLSKKAGKIVDDTLGNTVDEQTRTSIKKKGRKLLRGLFGKKKKPAVQPQ
ncbi:MAG TPA: AsmA family protein, partial [Rhizobiales bacterium]|nr:AsmA family protein [Hyphomicrobiales bacterium]